MDEDGSIVIVEGEYSANLDIAHLYSLFYEEISIFLLGC
jgi:hypothetical protein